MCNIGVAIVLVYRTLRHDIVANRRLKGSSTAETIKSLDALLTPIAPVSQFSTSPLYIVHKIC
jgi:hypothetical protein